MRSLSNMIKAYAVRYDDEAKKTIDTHFRIDKDLEEKRIQILLNQNPQEDDFVEGLTAFVVEALPSSEEISEKASVIIEDAKNEAKALVEIAKKEAEQAKKEALQTAQKRGYDEGMLQAKREAQKLKAEQEEKAQVLQKEYEDMALSLEPQMAQIIADLLEKMTGIIVEDKQEVILYLINKAIKNFDKCDNYTIKVSTDDYEYVSMRKNILLSSIGRDVPIYITEDTNLIKNQCLIETDLRVINCSLDVQLNNLITDLKLMSSI